MTVFEGPAPHILLVEDDADQREALEEYLRLVGFVTTGVGTALEFFQTLATTAVDVAIIDVGLPDQDGFDIAALLRARPDIGVVMLTARGAPEDRVMGFTKGADLYFVKPVNCPELAAALVNLVARLPGRAPSSLPVEGGMEGGISPDDWILDRATWSVRAPGDQEVSVTGLEMRLLDALMASPGVPIARGDLLQTLGYRDDASGRRSLDVLIWRLRRKIQSTVGGRSPIQTVHNRGYLFAAPVRLV